MSDMRRRIFVSGAVALRDAVGARHFEEEGAGLCESDDGGDDDDGGANR